MQILVDSDDAENEMEMGRIEEDGVPRTLDGRHGDWQRSLWAVLASFSVAFGYKSQRSWRNLTESNIWRRSQSGTWIGWDAASNWGWVLYPSPAYVGQGMIMGPCTCLSMLAGALMGFAVLGPIARHWGWAPGPISDVETGAAGWVLWISLAVMLADSITSLVVLALRNLRRAALGSAPRSFADDLTGVPRAWWMTGLLVCTVLCTVVVSPMFSMAFYQPVVAVVLAGFVSILAVRAMGETHFNPASGVGKISQVAPSCSFLTLWNVIQIVFWLIAPGRVVANIVAGPIAEAGAVQAGDMMQNFKTAHVLGVIFPAAAPMTPLFCKGVPPRPQFFAQLVGSAVSVVLSVGVYALYTHAWQIPSPELPVPWAQIWLDMARLFNGGALPQYVWLFATLFGAATAASVLYNQLAEGAAILPSGIGFAVGIYIGPKFTIPRLLGSLAEQLWKKRSAATNGALMLIVASGLVLGEGTGAIVVATVRIFKTTLYMHHS